MCIEFDKKDLFFILAVLAVSILLVVLIYPRFALMTTDGVLYALMGESLAKGEGLSAYGQPHLIFSPLLSVFIAAFFLVVKDLYLASHLGVIFCGLAAVIAIYVLAKEMVSQRVAQLAASFLAFCGVWVWQYNVAISAQITAGLFAILTVLALWKASNVKHLSSAKDYLWFLIAGVFIGLSYLARPEYFAILPLVLVYFFVLFRKIEISKLLIILLLVVLGFLIISSPYLLFLHKQLGYWSITGRAAEGSMGLSGVEMEKIDGMSGGTAIVAPPEFNKTIFQVLFDNFGMLSKRTLDNLLNAEHNFLNIFGFLGVGFFAFGLRKWLLERRFKEFIIFLVLFSPIIFVAMYQGATPNYLVQFLFIFFILIAVGFWDFHDKIISGFNLRGWRVKTLFVCLISITIFYFFFPALQNYLFLPKDYTQKEFKQMGLWMKENIPNIENETVYSRKPEVTFYAGSRWQVVPDVDSYEQLFSIMEKNNSKYLIADDRYFKDLRPQFDDLLFPEKAPEGLELIKTAEFYDKKVFLYQLEQ